MSESNAILRFLATKYNVDWFGGLSLAKRAQIDLLLDWQSTSIRAPIRDVIDLLSWKSEPDARDAALLQIVDFKLFGTDDLMFIGLPVGVHRMLEILETKHLAKSPFVAGEQISIADLPLFVDMILLEKILKQDLSRYAAISSWRTRVAAKFANTDVLSS
jgi:glutathione S-transferase